MINLQKNFNLSKLNTFGVNVQAKFFVEINDEQDLAELFTLPEFKQQKKIFLGGGSNVLFLKDFDGLVALNKLKGMEIFQEDAESALIRSMGGEVWHDLVMFAVNHGYWGIENLALIPGTVGAAPMQNIGAYGAELKDTLFNIEAYDIATGQKKIFSKKECELGYRESIFKNKLKGKYFISAITLKLNKKEKKNITYKILADYLVENKIEVRSSKDISDAVVSIRRSKLPDPKIIGNAGSFFKNVFAEKEQLGKLLQKFPVMPYFTEPTDTKSFGEAGEGIIKIPAGWLIEQCGFKGFRQGKVGVHDKQALVLVNYGGATGEEILTLANKIMASVKEKFGLELTPEVNIVQKTGYWSKYT